MGDVQPEANGFENAARDRGQADGESGYRWDEFIVISWEQNGNAETLEVSVVSEVEVAG